MCGSFWQVRQEQGPEFGYGANEKRLSLTTGIDLALCFVGATAPDIALVESMLIRLAVLG